MAINYNTKIPTDGLIFCVDAANPKSYAGTGTVWKDISGYNNNLHMVSNASVNPQWSNRYGGAFFFNGHISKSYFEFIPINAGYPLDSIYDATIVMWCEITGDEVQSRYYALDTRRGHTSIGAGMGYDRSGSTYRTFNFYGTGGYDEAREPSYTLSPNVPYMSTAVRTGNTIKIVAGDNKTLYEPPIASNTLGSGATNLDGFRVGGWNAGTTQDQYWWAGYIYTIMVWNRALNQDEITQLYAAHRARYGA